MVHYRVWKEPQGLESVWFIKPFVLRYVRREKRPNQQNYVNVYFSPRNSGMRWCRRFLLLGFRRLLVTLWHCDDKKKSGITEREREREVPQKLCSTYERLALPWQSNEKVSQTPAQKWGADRRRTEQNILKEAPEHRLSGSMGVKSVQSITSAQLIELSSTHTHPHPREDFSLPQMHSSSFWCRDKETDRDRSLI